MNMYVEWSNGLLKRYSVMRKEEIRDAIFDKVVLVPETEEDWASIIDDIAELQNQSNNQLDDVTLSQLLDRIYGDCEDALESMGLTTSDEPIKSMTSERPLSFLRGNEQISAIGLMSRMVEDAKEFIEREVLSRDQALGLALIMYVIGTHQGRVNMNKVRKPISSGRKVIDAGGEGGRSVERRKNFQRRNGKIFKTCQDLLNTGHDRRSIAGVLARKYSQLPGYPKSPRQYRRILKEFEK